MKNSTVFLGVVGLMLGLPIGLCADDTTKPTPAKDAKTKAALAEILQLAFESDSDPSAGSPENAGLDENLDLSATLGLVMLEMSDCSKKLSKQITGTPTQTQQEQIVSKLDQIIALLDKKCQQCQGSGASGNRPNSPLADSKIVGGPGGIGDLYAAPKDGKDWAQLPAKERDRILQAIQEKFPPHYKTVLERYYRRLAEEKPVEGTAPAANPSTTPTETAPTE